MNEIIIAAIHGFFLSLGLIIPLGIQNIFIFNQGAMQPTLFKALPSIITAAICDTIIIVLAVGGVSLIVAEIVWLKLLILSIGFIFLICMGFITWKQSKANVAQTHKVLSFRKQILFAASVSIFNPHAIMDTIAVIGTSSLNYYGVSKWAFLISCLAVSWVWFFAIAIIGHKVHKLSKRDLWMHVINKIAAIIIWSVSIYIGYQLIICIVENYKFFN